MDFGQVLHTAKQNERSSKNGIRYYNTKFEPPKKEQKKSAQLSENIKKFLAKKEAEEKRKAEEERRKREELLALRSQDKKATRRVNVMLKRTKSANQSVIEDAIDKDNTAVTLAGPMQPDEDDYGYVSQEAAALYNQMMEKYSKMPDEPKFNMFKKKVSTNLSSTKDRVKAALEREKEEALLPHKRKRKHKERREEDDEDGVSYEAPDRSVEEPTSIVRPSKPKPKPAPPPLNFSELLKIAEKKQYEPIIIEKKEKEEEKLLTKKQKKEMEREQEYLRRKEERRKDTENRSQQSSNPHYSDKTNEKQTVPLSSSNKLKLLQGQTKQSNENRIPKLCNSKPAHNVTKSSDPPALNNKGVSNITSIKNKLETMSSVPKDIKAKAPSRDDMLKKKPQSIPERPLEEAKLKKDSNNLMRKFLPPDVRTKKLPPAPELKKSKPIVQKDLKPKQFPPPDVRRSQHLVPKKPVIGSKRQILDDDEYDSEMDDFIDDGEPEDDYSKYISEIFGYDKSKYRDIDEDVDNMESSFAQQMKEEVISTKIGIMEDLEDIKKEEEEKRRKALLKKKRKL